MASKPKPKPKAKATTKASSKSSLVSSAVSMGASMLGIGAKTKGGSGHRRRKKSALFYAREIQRLKLKKRYEKIKIGV